MGQVRHNTGKPYKLESLSLEAQLVSDTGLCHATCRAGDHKRVRRFAKGFRDTVKLLRAVVHIDAWLARIGRRLQV